MTVIRPADANETGEAWKQALKITNGPTALILTRQGLPILEGEAYKTGVSTGAYILADCQGEPDILLIASGSEVAVTLKAKAELEKQGVKARLISMPSWELFDSMSESYKDRVLPPSVTKRLAVEAGIPMGWEKYVGSAGAVVGISGFGSSAPGGTVMDKYGFNVDNIVEKALACLKG